MPSRTLVIIPAYRAPHKLRRCIEHLQGQTHDPIDIWVHDNSDYNIGFTAAANLGLRHALRSGFDFALIINQDAYLAPDAAASMIQLFRDQPTCGIVGAKQLHPDDTDLITHGGCTRTYPWGLHIEGRKSKNECATSRRMPWVNGAVIGARLSAIVDIGLLDEGMFLSASDMDWCFTSRLRGWEVWYCAEAEAVHDGGVTTDLASHKHRDIFAKDNSYFKAKWLGSEAFQQLSQDAGVFEMQGIAEDFRWPPEIPQGR